MAPSASTLLGLWCIQKDGTIVTTTGAHLRAFELLGLDSEHLASETLLGFAEQLYEGMKRDLREETLVQFVLEGHGNYEDVFSRFASVPRPKDPVLAHQRARRLAFMRGQNLRRFGIT